MNAADWRDLDAVAARLTDAGIGSDCAHSIAPNFAAAAAALAPLGVSAGASVTACWSPGRIEVFGKHTDYCGGESILAAAERGFAMLAAPTSDDRIRIVDARNGDASEFRLAADTVPQQGHWANYPQTVARRVAKNFSAARTGAKVALYSNLPPSSGMSSSSAFVVGTFLVLSAINGLEQDPTYASVIHTPEDLASYLSTIENGLSFGPLTGDKGVGTFGGSEDHTAILCGHAAQLRQYAFCPIRFQRAISLADRYVFAIASSGVVAEKTGAAMAKYNLVSSLAREIVAQWQRATGHAAASLAAIVESSPDAIDQLRDRLRNASDAKFPAAELLERLEHFAVESELIRSVPGEIGDATVARFGELARSSHAAAALLLHNQTPETNRLVAIAYDLGAPAASAFGAGFGGSVWALVEQTSAAAYVAEWRSRYAAEFPEAALKSEFFTTRPGTAARLLRSDND